MTGGRCDGAVDLSASFSVIVRHVPWNARYQSQCASQVAAGEAVALGPGRGAAVCVSVDDGCDEVGRVRDAAGAPALVQVGGDGAEGQRHDANSNHGLQQVKGVRQGVVLLHGALPGVDEGGDDGGDTDFASLADEESFKGA